MNEEEAWKTANALTVGFGVLFIEGIAFLGICLLILGEFREWREGRQKRKPE
jgi:hypothetical protein